MYPWQDKIPPEIWQMIFKAATDVHGEFSLPHTQGILNPMTHRYFHYSSKNSDERKRVTPTRLAIIHVCKAWYHLGRRSLYSSFEIVSEDNMISFSEALENDSTLRRYVKLLVFKLPMSLPYSISQRLIGLCPNLTVLTILGGLTVPEASNLPISLTILNLQLEAWKPEELDALNARLDVLHHLVHLALSITNISAAKKDNGKVKHLDLPSITMKNLTTLHLEIQHRCPLIRDSILLSWHCPNLSFFFFQDWTPDKRPIRDILYSLSPFLVKLAISEYCISKHVGDVIHLPHLEELYLRLCRPSLPILRNLPNIIDLTTIKTFGLIQDRANETSGRNRVSFSQTYLGPLFEIMSDRDIMPSLERLETDYFAWHFKKEMEQCDTLEIWYLDWIHRFEEMGIAFTGYCDNYRSHYSKPLPMMDVIPWTEPEPEDAPPESGKRNSLNIVICTHSANNSRIGVV